MRLLSLAFWRDTCALPDPTPSPPSAWHVTRRLVALRGEERANALRVLGVAVFYAIEVMNHHGLALGPIELPRVAGVDSNFHALSTALTAAWLALSAAVVLAIKNRIFPPALPYLTTGMDLVLMTGVLTLADGPRSPMVLVLFLIVVLSGLRLSRRLVAFATSGAVISYLFVLGEVGQRREALRVPAHWQVTTIAALLLAGGLVYVTLLQARRAVEAYAALSQRDPEQ